MDAKQWYQIDAESVCAQQQTNQEKGLDPEEAARRMAEHGANELTEAKKVSALAQLLGQFKDFMVLVLVGAVVISGLLGEYLDAMTIIAIIVMNGILGFIQEFRAEKSLRALKQLASPMAKVMRGGVIEPIAARQLVAGDVIIVESGDRIPADIRFIEANSLYVEESALTGESVPVAKLPTAIHAQEVPLRGSEKYRVYGDNGIKGHSPRNRCSNRHGHRDGENCASYSAYGSKRNTVTASIRTIGENINSRGNRPDDYCRGCWYCTWSTRIWHVPGRCKSCCSCYSRRASGDCYDCTSARRTADDQTKGDRAKAAVRGDIGLRFSDLFGQDRHAYPEQDDGYPSMARRRTDGSNRQWI